MFTDEQKTQLVEKLTTLLNRNRPFTCPMCGGTTFGIVDGYFINPIQDEFNHFRFAKDSIPTVSILCSDCGYLSQHALGVVDPLSMKVKTNAQE